MAACRLSGVNQEFEGFLWFRLWLEADSSARSQDGANRDRQNERVSVHLLHLAVRLESL